jgi:hypothetical protein
MPTTTNQARFVERVQFFNGQRLFASDLQALEEFNRQMRWLHNQSLHQPGVGSGYAVSGPKGAREIVIQPGYAIDALGREIVLTEPRVEPIPPVANDGFGNSAFYDLTLAYPDDSQLEESETREGICLPRGVVRRREEPVVCWVRLGPPPDRVPENGALRDDLQKGYRIRLGRAEILNCQLEQPLSVAQRRNARPPVQPYVSCGRTSAEGWNAPAAQAFGIAISRTVDTSDAHFRTRPCYMAHVRGDRHFTFTIGDQQIELMLDGFVHILEPEPDRFDIAMLIPALLLEAPGVSGAQPIEQIVKQLPEKLVENGWAVEWTGIEG